MQRQLPIITIQGTSFIVDVAKGELRQSDNPANSISFDDMQDKGTHYSFSYDRIEKNLPSSFKSAGNDIVKVTILQMVDLDPMAMAEKHGLEITKLQGKNDFELIVDQQVLVERLNGRLPTINIAGHDFIVDLRLNELRPENDFSTRIDLRNLDISNDGEKFLCFYHPASKNVVEINPALMDLPKGVVMLEIPNELNLDPVAVARKYGLEDREFLRQYPLHKKLEAKVIPLSETGLPALILKNKQAIAKQQQKATKSLQSKRRKRI